MMRKKTVRADVGVLTRAARLFVPRAAQRAFYRAWRNAAAGLATFMTI